MDPFGLHNEPSDLSPRTDEYIASPPPGDRYDSRWGGPVAWDQRMRDYSSLGVSGGPRPFSGLGKVDLAQTLPTAPVIPGPRGISPTQAPPPQPGLAESFTRGLTGMVTQFIPNGDVQSGADKVASVIGGSLDFLPSLVPTMEFLPGGANVEDTFWKVRGMNPDDKTGLEYEAFVKNDVTNAARYMSEYLNSRGSEVSEAMGVSGVFAPLVTPSLNFSEQMRRIVFGGLTGLGDTMARTVGGSGIRDVQGSVLDKPMEELPEELQELRGRYESGAITYDQMLDEMAIGRFRWTNDDSAWGAALSFGLDVVTDPFTWASLGIGGAAKSAATGSVRLAQVRIAGALKATDRAGNFIPEAARKTTPSMWDDASLAVREQTGRSTGDLTAEIADWAKTNRPQQYEQGLGTMSRRQRGLYAAEPIIQPAAAVANKIDNPFSWIPAGRIGQYLGNNITTNHMRGFVNAHGTNRVLKVQNTFRDKDQFSRYLGIAGENQNLSLHQQQLVRDVLAADPEFRGDMMVGAGGEAIGPGDVIGARQSVSKRPISKRREWNDAAIGEAEEHTVRNMESIAPAGETGKQATEGAYNRQREMLSQPLAEMSGMSLKEAQAFLAKADRQTLAFVHQLNYGKTISDFIEAKNLTSQKLDVQIKQALSEGDEALAETLRTKKQSVDESYTLVSTRHLTRERAETLLQQLEDAPSDEAAGAIARDAVNRFDQLDQNYADARFSDARLGRDMKAHLKQLLEKSDDGNSRLIEVLSADEVAEVAPDLVNRLGRQGDGMYDVGLAPKDRWGATTDTSGRVTGINTFIDVMDDSGVPVTRAFGNRDRIRSGLLENIRGSRIHYEARERFVENGVRSYGLTKGDSRRLFDELRQQSIKREMGTRGFTAEQVNDIAKDIKVDIESAMYDKVGERGLLELLVRSWEGELKTVGLTSKVSGAVFKSPMVKRTNNLVGRISENLYPYLRFGLSPMFLAMELTEGPFFAVLRGVKPGIRWTEDDIRLNSILSDINTGAKYTDQLEKAQLAFAEGKAVNKVVTNTRLTRYWNKLAPQRMARRTVSGKVETSLFEYKRLLYIRQWGKDAAVEMKENSMRYYPDAWSKWEAELGTADPTKVFMAIMEERGVFDHNQRHGLHMFDAAKPRGLGRMERIRQGDVAAFHGFDSANDFRDALKAAPSDSKYISRDAFVQKYTDLNLNREYAERAYTVARGLTSEEWATGIKDRFAGLEAGGAAAAEVYTNLHGWMARKQGMDFAEYMNVKYGDLPNIVDDLPEEVWSRGMFQSLHETMERSGMKMPTKTQRRQMQKYSQSISPPKPSDAPGSAGYKNSRSIVLAQKRLNAEDATKRAAELDSAAPTGKSVLRDADDADGHLRVMAEVEKAAGGSDNVVQWGNWYSEMPDIWYGSLSKMPDSTITAWSKAMDDVIPAGVARLDDPRMELAVRMNLAFTIGQQNTSVNRGFQMAFQMLDEVAQGQAERGYKWGIPSVTKRMEALLRDMKGAPPEELAQKLYDFSDSMAGKTTRTFTEGMDGAKALQPAAMDVWMMRFFNYPDSVWFDLKVEKHMTDTGVSRGTAEASVLKENDWTREDVALKKGSPNTSQYERMLQWVNDYKDTLNADSYGGRTDWTAAEVQAQLWVHTQKSVDYVDASAPNQLLVREGQQASLRLDDFGTRMPSLEKLREAYGDEGADSVANSIAHDVVKGVLPTIMEETGVGALRIIDSVQRAGRHVDPEDGIIGTNVPTATVAFFGTPKQIDEAMGLMGSLLQQDRLVSLSDTTAEAAARSNGMTWTLDFEFGEALDQNAVRPHLADLNDYLDAMNGELGRGDIFPDSMTALTDNDALMVSQPWVTKGSRKRADFEAQVDIPEQYMAELADGTWVHRFDSAADPIPVTINRRVKSFTETGKDTHAQRMRDAGRANADEVIGRHASTVQDIVDAAYARRAGKVYKSNIDTKSAADPGAPGVWAQRGKTPSGRATTGRSGVRAAFDAGTAEHGATAYFVRGAADATSAVHEAFHLFARDLDASGHSAFIDAYGASNPTRRAIADAARADGRMTREVEEWVSAEFEKWAAGDMSSNIHLKQTFKGFAEWGEEAGLGEASPHLKPVFDDVMRRESGYDGTTWHADEQRWWESTRLSNMRAEEQAHATAYYRRGRNVIERSINHPYLGMYPASYMWGKVLPEMTRFLISRPFGLQAPLLGLSMATHAWTNLQLQLQVDEGLREWVDEHPDTVRMLQLMVPGTPWELPANLPVMMRRAMELDAENKLRVLQGKEPKEFDAGGTMADMLSYSVGFTNLTRRVGDMVGEFSGDDDETAAPPITAPAAQYRSPFAPTDTV